MGTIQELIRAHCDFTVADPATGQVSYGYSQTLDSRFFRETRPDRVRTRKPTGWLYPKPYDLDMLSATYPKGIVEYDAYGSRFNNSGNLGTLVSNLPLVDEPIDANLQRTAEIKALVALKDQKVNYGIALATAQQTADLLGTTGARLAKAYQYFRQGKYRNALRSLKQDLDQAPKKVKQRAKQAERSRRNAELLAPGAWLETQYAWKPFVSDIHGSVDLLMSSEISDWVVTVKGKARSVNKSERLVLRGEAGCYSHYELQETVQGHFVRLDYIPANDLLILLSSLGLTNPLEVLWDKLPYSFVVDWVLPIGEWLSTFDAAVGYEFLSGSHSVWREAKVKVSPGGPRPPGLRRREFSEGRARQLRLSRSVYTKTPVIMRPRWKNPLSLGHMANGLSLLATAFGRR